MDNIRVLELILAALLGAMAVVCYVAFPLVMWRAGKEKKRLQAILRGLGRKKIPKA